MKDGVFVAVCLLLAVSYCRAQVFSWGWCPKVEVKKDFNTAKYYGNWYEVLHFPAIFEEDTRCNRAVYSPNEDGGVRIVNSAIIISTGEITSIEGYAYAPNPDVPAKLKVKFSTSFFTGDYWVLDTDYETFSMVHSCSSWFFFNYQINWLLSPIQNAKAETVSDALRKFEEAGIDVSHFMKTNQMGCPDF